jgi:hypothetical protein
MTVLVPYMRRQARRLTVVLLADSLSFGLFMLLVGQGVHMERNPLIAAVYLSGGVMGVVALKLAAALLFEVRAARTPPRPVSRGYAAGFALLSSLAIAATLTGAAANLASLLDALGVRM